MGSLRDAIAATQGSANEHAKLALSPICNPCSSGDHAKCPTVLSEYGGVIASTYNCPCYRRNEEQHQDNFDQAQEDWENSHESPWDGGTIERPADGGNWSGGSYYPQGDYDKHDWYPGRYR